MNGPDHPAVGKFRGGAGLFLCLAETTIISKDRFVSRCSFTA